MKHPWKILRRMSRVSSHVIARRLRSGARHKDWNLLFEILLERLHEQYNGHGGSLKAQREALDAFGAAALYRPLCKLSSHTVAGLHVREVSPHKPSRDIVLYLHGGGYVAGSSTSHLPLLTHLAHQSRARVFAVDYRLAPEFPCPAAIEDVCSVWRTWLKDPDFDPADVVIAGDSAGGGLVWTSLIAMRTQGLPLPRAAITLSPWTDLSVSGDIPEIRAQLDYLGTRESLYAAGAVYAGSLSREDPRVSPLFTPDLTGLPPTLVLTGDIEVLRDDSERMVARLREAGVRTEFHLEPGGVHVYPLFAAVSGSGQRGVKAMSAWIQSTRR